MPSPRSSPAMRPSSPLTYSAYKTPMHYDSLQPPSRQANSRPLHNSRRGPNGPMKLSSLPRFHPANFPSAHSSIDSTPDGTGSPQPPVSPRAHQRMYGDSQKYLYMCQRDAITFGPSSSPSQVGKPNSPRLAPLGSPGPVTPLVLEGEEGYLAAGARNVGSSTPSTELVDRIINEEARRHRSPRDESSRITK